MLSTLKATPFPITLIILSFLCPTELSLYVADLRLPPHRIALLILSPLAIMRIISRSDIRIRSFDVFFLLYNVWTIAVFLHHTEPGNGENTGGLVFGGSLALESFGAYVIARAWVHNSTAFRASLKFLAAAITLSAVIALPETLFGQHFSHDILQSLTGYEHPRKLETRLHLTRAYGTFDHPIHLGTFCATAFAMVWYVSNRPGPRFRRTMIIGLATLAALSSAPILCLFTQIGLIIWDRATRGLKNRVTISVLLVIGAFFAASMISTRSPFAWIATGLTIDSWTGYYRLLIWQHGMENVFAHPWIGLGLGDWARPWWMVSDSVDAFWLVVTMRMGIPAFLLIAIAMALLLREVTKRGANHSDPLVRNMTKAWVMSLIALILVGCTVHYWNVLHAFFFFFLGLAGWIADPSPKRKARRRRSHTSYAQATLPPFSQGFAPEPIPSY